MKKQSMVSMIALLATAAFSGVSYAQEAVPAIAPAAVPAPAPSVVPTVAPTAALPAAPADKGKTRESSKEQVQKESADLSPEKAKIYNDAMQKAIESNKAMHAEIRKAYQEADALLTAPTFDKKAYLAKTAEIDQLYAKQRAAMSDAFVSVVEKFSQDDRKILLKARNEHRRHS